MNIKLGGGIVKYVLLIMTVLQIKTFWNSFKAIFTTTKGDYKRVDEIMSQVNSTVDTNTVGGLMIIIAFLYAILLTIYYILTGVYLGGVGFAILSCMFIMRSWRNVGKTIKWIANQEDKSIFNKTILTRLYSATYLAYIGYFVYFLITTW